MAGPRACKSGRAPASRLAVGWRWLRLGAGRGRRGLSGQSPDPARDTSQPRRVARHPAGRPGSPMNSPSTCNSKGCEHRVAPEIRTHQRGDPTSSHATPRRRVSDGCQIQSPSALATFGDAYAVWAVPLTHKKSAGGIGIGVSGGRMSELVRGRFCASVASKPTGRHSADRGCAAHATAHRLFPDHDPPLDIPSRGGWRAILEPDPAAE